MRLETIPRLANLFADGAPPIGRVAALLIGRIASPASLPDWIALARPASVRELRDAGRDLGSFYRATEDLGRLEPDERRHRQAG